MRIDDATRFRETSYVVEATAFERHMLWAEWHCFVHWIQDMVGYNTHVGAVGQMPVAVEVFWYGINGRRVAFFDATSQVVDHRMVERWLNETFVCLREFEPGRRPYCDAMNFGNAMAELWPSNKRPAHIVAEMQRRYRENTRLICQ